ncbi:hypothetical protein BDZ45DRAFT_679498 [Acephala macrosclerotiorum]|nr:hypothetical protein BDZ45DRAFT_679498 [Acephala macrosclerotiorum]
MDPLSPPYPPTTEPHTSIATPITSALVPPIPVPTHGPGGHFTVISKTIISAAPTEVLSLIRDTNTWSSWNTFCPSCVITKTPKDLECTDVNVPTEKEGWLDLGSEATIDVFMEGDGLIEGRKRSRTQGVCITRLVRIEEEGRRGYRIAWKGTGWSHWQLRSERVMEMVEVEGEGGMKTDYVCWETFGGMLGPMIKMVVGSQLVDRFGDYSRDLRQYFEGRKKGAQNGPA